MVTLKLLRRPRGGITPEEVVPTAPPSAAEDGSKTSLRKGGSPRSPHGTSNEGPNKSTAAAKSAWDRAQKAGGGGGANSGAGLAVAATAVPVNLFAKFTSVRDAGPLWAVAAEELAAYAVQVR